MAFRIRMGVPEMEAFWNDVSARKLQGKLSQGEETFFKKLVKALAFLGQNPRHPGLASHEIDDLTRKHGMKIFQSCFLSTDRVVILLPAVWAIATATLDRSRRLKSPAEKLPALHQNQH